MKITAVYADLSVPFQEYEKYMKYISEERQEKIKRYRHDKKKIISLFAELLVRYKFSQKYGTRDISFGYNEYGKPYVNDYPQYHFSLSHSGEYIVFAENSEPIGIDIEKTACNIRVARRFFTEYEAGVIENSDEKEKMFCRVWTSKEAYVKMLGTGFAAMHFNTFNVLDNSLDCKFFTYPLNDKYMITLCGKNIEEDIEKEEISFEKIIDFFC
ncbi:MAG: 4'-phosphopantetheinyl transferase family protein [Oscillospiraceae bacterium]